MAPNEQEEKGGDLTKYLIISLISTVILCVVFAGVNYFVMENLLTQKISKIQVSTEELDAGDEGQDGVCHTLLHGLPLEE